MIFRTIRRLSDAQHLRTQQSVMHAWMRSHGFCKISRLSDAQHSRTQQSVMHAYIRVHALFLDSDVRIE